MSDSFKSILKKVHEAGLERIRKAGKHTCIPVKAGACRRLTGRGGVILKKPVLVFQFYECKICGRTIGKWDDKEVLK